MGHGDNDMPAYYMLPFVRRGGEAACVIQISAAVTNPAAMRRSGLCYSDKCYCYKPCSNGQWYRTESVPRLDF